MELVAFVETGGRLRDVVVLPLRPLEQPEPANQQEFYDPWPYPYPYTNPNPNPYPYRYSLPLPLPLPLPLLLQLPLQLALTLTVSLTLALPADPDPDPTPVHHQELYEAQKAAIAPLHTFEVAHAACHLPRDMDTSPNPNPDPNPIQVAHATCHLPSDMDTLLAAIESGFGSHTAFNIKVRHTSLALTLAPTLALTYP